MKPERILDHYETHLRQHDGHQLYGGAGFDHGIQMLRYNGMAQGCIASVSLGFGRLVSKGDIGVFEVIVVADAEHAAVEHLLVKTLFAIAEHSIPIEEGISIGGLHRVAPEFVKKTGKSAFYFTYPTFLPDQFGTIGDNARILWAFPISASEHEYAKAHGDAAFEDLLEEREVDPMEIMRSSAV